jgi:inner membrane protein
MDNITHTLAAVAIAKTGVGRVSRVAPAAIIVAANVPDLDIVVRHFGGSAAYFVHHRGITHALPGVALQIPLLTTLFWLIHRLIERRAKRNTETTARGVPAIWWRLCLAVTCGIATQPLFDWLNTYGLRPWLPFDDTWYYGDLAFIVDPWLWLLFGGAACLAGRRTWWGSVALAVVAVLGLVFMWSTSRLEANAIPVFLQIAWSLIIVALGLARWRGVGHARPHTVVAVAAVLSVAYLAGLGWAGRAAWRQHGAQLAAQFAPGETLQRHMWSPQRANPLAWTLIAETERAVYRQDVNLFGGARPAVRLERNLDVPEVVAALETPDGRAWRSFARFPVAAILPQASSRRVLLLDARYPADPPQRNWCRMLIDLDGEAAPGATDSGRQAERDAGGRRLGE